MSRDGADQIQGRPRSTHTNESEQMRISSRKKPTEICLVFPPPWAPFQPYASLPYLAGAVMQEGIACKCIDASVEFHEFVLKPEEVSFNLSRIDHRPAGCGSHSSSGAVSLFRDDLLERASLVTQILRGPDFYRNESRTLAINLLSQALAVVSKAYDGVHLSLHSGKGPWTTHSSRALMKHVFDPPENPFERFYDISILPQILREKPRIVGISVISEDQVFPALLLSRMIRSSLPGTRTVLGGPFFSANPSTLSDKDHPIYQVVDHVIVGEGESALVSLVRSCSRGKRSPDRLLRGLREKLTDLPAPAYHELPLWKYFSPEPVLTLLGSRGCYWNKCQFCDIVGIGEEGWFRSVPVDQFVRQIKEVSVKTQSRCFAFWDNSMPPKSAQAISETLLEERESFYWSAQIRADTGFDQATCKSMFQAGCRQVFMGIETGSQELADKMCKGIRIEEAQTVARRFTRAGVAVAAGYFFGFPGESDNDVNKTLAFMLANKRFLYPSSKSIGVFSLRRGSPLYQEAKANRTRIVEPGENDWALDIDFEYDGETRLSRYALAEKVIRFLESEGYDEDRFGPHYLLLQAAEKESLPKTLSGRNGSHVLASLSLSSDIAWLVSRDTRDSSDSLQRVLAYVRRTAQIVELGDEWISWLARERLCQNDTEASDFRKFLRGYPSSLIRRLVAVGILETNPHDHRRQERTSRSKISGNARTRA